MCAVRRRCDPRSADVWQPGHHMRDRLGCRLMLHVRHLGLLSPHLQSVDIWLAPAALPRSSSLCQAPTLSTGWAWSPTAGPPLSGATSWCRRPPSVAVTATGARCTAPATLCSSTAQSPTTRCRRRCARWATTRRAAASHSRGHGPTPTASTNTCPSAGSTVGGWLGEQCVLHDRPGAA